MKKSLTLIILATIFLVGCTGSSYNVDRTDLTPDDKQESNELIDKALEDLKAESVTQEEEVDLYNTLAYHYSNLGNNDQAIIYYEKILNIDPTNFIALNNLADIYEEAEAYDLAATYIIKLHTQYKDQQGVVSDTIRILTKNGAFDDAQLVLEEYASNYQSEETGAFISEKFEYIMRMRAAAAEKEEL